MANLYKIRQVCTQSLNALANAEKSETESKRKAEQIRQQSLDKAMFQFQQSRSFLNKVQLEIQKCRSDSERRLLHYKIQKLAQATVNPQKIIIQPNQITKQINTQLELIKNDIRALDRDGLRLEIERRKWWKFW